MGSEKWKLRNPKKITRNLIPIPLFFIFHFLVLISSALAEDSINISADHLEYLRETNTYISKGSVKIIYKDATLNADEIRLNNSTLDAIATGNVIYEDTETIIKSDRVELNLETKLGKIYHSYIFYKKENYHLRGGELKKIGEKNYILDKATVTTCDADPPEWHISGKDIKATKHENIKVRNATFYIKGVPVLYSPYFYAPLIKERQTGLLIPSLGYSNTKGLIFKQGFFWAIRDNMDATFYVDYYSKKGVGKGLDYRYIVTPKTNGELWMHHLRDNDLSRDFLELKSYHKQELPYGMSGYLKLHLVNEFDFYDVVGPTSTERFGTSSLGYEDFGFKDRPMEYVESNLNISRHFSDGTVYLLNKYKQSLEGSSKEVPQYLPEIGLALYTKEITKYLSFNMNLTGTNFWREEGQYGQRIDIYPNVYLSTGRIFKFAQRVGVRETAYVLKNPAKNPHREIFDLESTLTMGLFKKYPSFTHLIEPSLEYAYIPRVDHSDITVFDSVDSIPQISDITYSLTNRFFSEDESSGATFRVSQTYSFLNIEKPFKPLLVEARFSNRRLDLSANISYDIYDDSIAEAIASSTFRWAGGFIGIAKSFKRSTFVDQYAIEGGINSPLKIYGTSVPMSLYGKVLYDIKGNGVQEAQLRTIYNSQCWGFTISYTRRPAEYQIMFGVEFRGFASLRRG